MKQFILCSIVACAVLMGNICKAQVTQTQPQSAQGTPYYNNFTTPFASTIISHTAPSVGNNDPSSANTYYGSRIAWLEYGDGGFTSNGNSTRKFAVPVSQLDKWLFVSSKLYDNTRDQLRINSGGPFSLATSSRNNPSDNDAPILTSANSANTSAVPPKILITPSTYDIVSKDTMCFALTYKFSPTPGKNYYIVFSYNNNIFLPITSTFTSTSVSNPTNAYMAINNNQNQIKYARTFHGEIYFPNIPQAAINLIPAGYTNNVAMKLSFNTNSTLDERNMFFSLVTKDNLVEGNSTSINATIIETDDAGNYPSFVDQHTIAGMAVRPSHDPNYIVQTPVCLQLPKAPKHFQYHLHFQNTGPGEADQVKIILQFSPGFDFNTFNITRARFSDDNYYNNINNGITILKTPTLNQVELTMDLQGNRNLNNPLAGTNTVLNPWTSLETMGDIYFNMQATAAVPYFITSQAGIKFHSLQTQQPEPVVATNTAISAYSTCCDCSLFNCGNSKDSTNRIKKSIPIRKNK